MLEQGFECSTEIWAGINLICIAQIGKRLRIQCDGASKTANSMFPILFGGETRQQVPQVVFGLSGIGALEKDIVIGVGTSAYRLRRLNPKRLFTDGAESRLDGFLVTLKSRPADELLRIPRRPRR